MERYVRTVLSGLLVVGVALACLGLASAWAPPPAAAWVHENGEFSAPNTVTGYVDGGNGEEDWWSVYLTQGCTYRFWTAYHAMPSLDDSVMTIFNPSGSQVGYNDDNGTNQWSYYEYMNVPSSGWYRVQIRAFASDHYGWYQLNVGLQNRPPTGSGDTYYGTEDTYMYVAASGVLGNDYDPDGYSQMQASHYSGPSHGYLSLNSDGSFGYTPYANYNGWDSFQYRVYDGYTFSDPITVNIHSSAVQDAPVASDDGWYYATEDASYTGYGLLSNDVEYDGQTMVPYYYDGPSHGSVSVRADGSFVYTPNANYYGTDSFRYRVTDGFAWSSPATVYISVSDVPDPPVGVNDSIEATEDVQLSVAAPGLVGNDVDVDNRTLSATLVTPPLHGEVTMGANGAFTYASDENYNGSDLFTYRPVDDGQGGSVATATVSIAAVNDIPTPVADEVTVTEDEFVTLDAPGVLGNDPEDVEGDPLQTYVWTEPSHGDVVLETDGSLTYTPDPDYFGDDEFWYRIYDGTDYSTPGKVSITVIGTPDAPVSVAETYETNEDTTLDKTEGGGVLVNDYDVDRDVLTALLVTPPSHGTLTLRANGNFTYVPDANWYGVDSFEYNPYDGALHGITQTVYITVKSVNDPPVSADDSYSTDEDVALGLTSGGVLDNDSDPVEGSSLTASLVTDVAHGTLSLGSDGLFTYTPSANWHGSDAFKYKCYDGESYSDTATVSITVASVNDTPTTSTDSYSTNEDTQLEVGGSGVLGNDSDIDADSLSASLSTDVSHGSLSLQSNGRFTYTPSSNWYGSDSFTYRAYDGHVYSTPETVTITVTSVNDPPSATDDALSVDEDDILGIGAPGVMSNDSDTVEGSAISAYLVTGVSHGVLNLRADGGLSYSPTANFHGTDRFVYRVNDGTDYSQNATVTITVASVNDKPVAVDDAYSTDEDVSLEVSATPGLLANDSDVDSETITASKLTDPDHGSVTVEADGSFRYVPTAGWSGTDSFMYRAHDGTGYSEQARVTITVRNVYDPPVSIEDTYDATEDQTLTVSAPGPLSNDLGDGPLTVNAWRDSSHGTAGTVTMWPDGRLRYVPPKDYTGTDQFQYRINDPLNRSLYTTVTINVLPENDPPVAMTDATSTAEDTTKTIAVLANDVDVDGDSMTPDVVSQPVHGAVTVNDDGTIRYVPATDYHGADMFSYRAYDGTAYSEAVLVTLEVTSVYDLPRAADDTASTNEDTMLEVSAPGVLGNDPDPIETATKRAQIATSTAHGVLSLHDDGSYSYIPEANWFGDDTFTYRVSDGDAVSDPATVTISVTSVNDVPTATADAYSTDEDTKLEVTGSGVLGNDSDPVEHSTLTADLVTGASHGTVDLKSDGTFTYEPAADWNGSDSFTYRASDGTDYSGTVSVSITVRAVNDAPRTSNDSYDATEDTLLTVDAPGVLGNDTEVEHDPMTASVSVTAGHGTVSLQTDGSFTYMPDPNWNGEDHFHYTVSDGSKTSDAATVTLKVASVNDAPTATADSYSTDEDTQLDVGSGSGVLSNDSDPVEHDPIVAELVSDVSHGTLELDPDGSFTYTPDDDWHGTDSFTYRADDGADHSNTVTVEITVRSVNDAPVPVADTASTAEDTQLSVSAPGVLGNDTDVDGDTLSASLHSDVSHGTLSLHSDGSYTYTPAENWYGTDSFSYDVSDGHTSAGPVTVTISVSSVNDNVVGVADTGTTAEDTALSVSAPGVLGNDTDVDGDTLSAVLYSTVAHGSLTLRSNGSYTYTPAANYHGSDSFRYRAYDGTAYSSPVTVSLTVTSVNDAPNAVDDSVIVAEDHSVTVDAPGVLGNDTDVEGSSLSADLVSGPSHGTLSLHADGSYTYEPDAGYHGADAFTYRASDGSAGSNGTVDITVTAKPTTTLTIWTSSTVCTYTVGATISGMLSSDSGPIEGGTVVFESSSDGDHWTEVGSDATDSHGVVEFDVDPQQHTYYRLRFAETADHDTGSSDELRQLVRALVSTPECLYSQYFGHTYTVWGTIKPAHTSGELAVRVYLYRWEGGRWKSYGYRNATTSAYNGYSKYSARIKLPAKGKWRVKAYSVCGELHVRTWAPGYHSVLVH